MRKVSGKKKDSTNGEDDSTELQDVESDVENGDDNSDADADQNGDAKGKDGDASDTNDEDDDDLPLKERPSEKGGKSKKKKSGKAKKEKKRVTLDVPEGDDDDDDEDDAEEEYEVANIVAHKYIGKKLYYQIRWKNYTADDDTWEPKDSLSCPDIIKKYEAANDVSKESENGGGKGKKRGRPAAKGKGGAKPAKKPKKAVSEDEEDEDPDKEYEVQRVLDVRNKKNGTREFLVHWKGWSSRFDSWEPEDNLSCDKLIADFDAKWKKAKNTTAKDLRIAPKATKHFTSSSNRAGGVRASKRKGGKERVTYYDDE